MLRKESPLVATLLRGLGFEVVVDSMGVVEEALVSAAALIAPQTKSSATVARAISATTLPHKVFIHIIHHLPIADQHFVSIDITFIHSKYTHTYHRNHVE